MEILDLAILCAVALFIVTVGAALMEIKFPRWQKRRRQRRQEELEALQQNRASAMRLLATLDAMAKTERENRDMERME